jgi:hypothetical protein
VIEPLSWLVPSPPIAIVVLLVTYVLVYPFATLCHELGHAAVALLSTDGRVVVRLGTTQTWSLSLGRTTLKAARFPGLAGGSCSFETYPTDRAAAAALFLAGPAVSLGLISLALWLLTTTASVVLRFGLVLLVLQQGLSFVLSIVPMEYQSELGLTEPAYDGLSSDGDRALEAWRTGGGPPSDDSETI